MIYLKIVASFCALLCYLAPISAAFAQNTEDYEVWGNISETMGLITEMDYQVSEGSEGEWLVKLGVIGGLAPEYRGSEQYKFSGAPNIHIEWNDFLYLKGRKLGVRFINAKHVYGGAFLRYNGGREDDDDGLRGLGDISRTVTSGVYLNFRYQGIRLRTEVRHDFLDEGHGTLVIMRLGVRLPWKDPLFRLELETSWADDVYMDTFFSVSNFQSLRSGLSQYRAESGLRDVSLSLSSGFEIDQHWSLSGQVRYRRLLGDAADSPIVSEVGSENNFVVGLGLNYTF
jgi:outer membrane protein